MNDPPQFPSARSLAGSQLGQYRVDSLIGRGGMGEVYKGWDTRASRPVAIKVLRGVDAGDPGRQRRFSEEVRMAPRVVHPYVATVYNVVDAADGPALVMEFVEGETFDEHLRQAHPVRRELLRLFEEVSDALIAIHGHGLVHRDLKPGNVMVGRDGHVKVMDFGVALREPPQASDSETTTLPDLTSEGVAVGTPAYMSPEQVRGERADARSDLFSLGVMLYESVTGAHPFARATAVETTAAILHDDPPASAVLARDPGLNDLVSTLLRKNARERPTSALDVRERLRMLSQQIPGSPPARIRARILAGIAVVAVIGVVTTVALHARHSASPAYGGTGGRPAVAVVPFVTGDGIGAERGRMVADLLSQRLGDGQSLQAVSQDRVGDVLAEAPPGNSSEAQVRRLATSIGATYFVAGRIYREGDRILAAVELFSRGGSLLGGNQPRRVGGTVLEAGTAADLVLPAGRWIADILKPAVGGGQPGAEAEDPPGASEAALAAVVEARAKYQQARYDEAVAILNPVLEKEPDVLDAILVKADALYASGHERDAREAIGSAERAIATLHLSDNSRAAMQTRAAHAEIFGKPEEAAKAFTALTERYPDEPANWLRLARARFMSGAYPEALTACDTAVGLDPSNPRSQLLRGRILARAGRKTESNTAFAKAQTLWEVIGGSAGAAEIASVRAWAAYIAADYPAAQQGYSTANRAFADAKLDVRAAISSKQEGDALLMQWKANEAEQRYNAAIPVLRQGGCHYEITSALGSLSALQFRLGRVKDAERTRMDALDEATLLDNAELRLQQIINLAVLLNLTGRTREARERASEALKMADERHDENSAFYARLQQASADYREGRFTLAAAEQARLAEGCHADLVGHNQALYALQDRVITLLAADDREGSVGAAEQAVPVARATGDAGRLLTTLSLRAIARARAGDPADAEPDLAEARKLLAGQEDIPDLHLIVRYAEGEQDLAEKKWARVASRPEPDRAVQSAWLVPLIVQRSVALKALGQDAESGRLAREVASHPWATASERGIAQALIGH